MIKFVQYDKLFTDYLLQHQFIIFFLCILRNLAAMIDFNDLSFKLRFFYKTSDYDLKQQYPS